MAIHWDRKSDHIGLDCIVKRRLADKERALPVMIGGLPPGLAGLIKELDTVGGADQRSILIGDKDLDIGREGIAVLAKLA
jgi:hypothetical protein